jgi:hypothetical protein
MADRVGGNAMFIVTAQRAQRPAEPADQLKGLVGLQQSNATASSKTWRDRPVM